ncbi:uncharacterized protein B0T15DRAFT_14316 [Chaetomium strumarium]|uniref:Uncharacterized protein n=1 Tax=Chaetomium strumarium TaxID=1170767 RepID=A0AAJ0H0W2_9PEZI|nr:hypothetical protein B0T15DRAFT_14316 [Chaetomium strumarium]
MSEFANSSSDVRWPVPSVENDGVVVVVLLEVDDRTDPLEWTSSDPAPVEAAYWCCCCWCPADDEVDGWLLARPDELFRPPPPPPAFEEDMSVGVVSCSCCWLLRLEGREGRASVCGVRPRSSSFCVPGVPMLCGGLFDGKMCLCSLRSKHTQSERFSRGSPSLYISPPTLSHPRLHRTVIPLALGMALSSLATRRPPHHRSFDVVPPRKAAAFVSCCSGERDNGQSGSVSFLSDSSCCVAC